MFEYRRATSKWGEFGGWSSCESLNHFPGKVANAMIIMPKNIMNGTHQPSQMYPNGSLVRIELTTLHKNRVPKVNSWADLRFEMNRAFTLELTTSNCPSPWQNDTKCSIQGWWSENNGKRQTDEPCHLGCNHVGSAPVLWFLSMSNAVFYCRPSETLIYVIFNRKTAVNFAKTAAQIILASSYIKIS